MKQVQRTVFCVIGGPSSGKTSQCQRLIRDFQFQYIPLSQLIRKQIQNNSELGQKMQKFVQGGKLVPFPLINKIIASQVQGKNGNRYLIEGYPRNITQVEQLSSDYHISVDKIIHLQVSQRTIGKKHQQVNKSERIDDKQQIYKQKILTYINEVKPTISHMNKFGIVHTIKAQANQIQVYQQLKKYILPNVLFLYGPPCTGKSYITKQLQNLILYTPISLDQFYSKRPEVNNIAKVKYIYQVNALINYLLTCTEKNVIFDDLFFTSAEVKIFLSKFGQPFKIYYFQTSKDQIDSKLLKYIKNPQQRQLFIQKYQNFVQNREEILKLVHPLKGFIEIDANCKKQQIKNHIMKDIRPKLILTYVNQCQQQSLQFLDKLQEQFGYIHLNVEDQCHFQKNLRTQLGKIIQNFINSGQKVPEDTQLELIRKRIYANPRISHYTISIFPNTIHEVQRFQNVIGQPDYYLNFAINTKPLSYSRKQNSLIKYMEKGNLITITQNKPILLIDTIQNLPSYALIIGPTASGKTTIIKELSKQLTIVMVDWEVTINYLKQKLSGDDPIQEVPIVQIIKYFKNCLYENRQNFYIFDGFPYQKKVWNEWVSQIGFPQYLITLDIQRQILIQRCKLKQIQISEEDQSKVDEIIKKNQEIQQFYKNQIQNYSKAKHFALNANSTIDKTVALIREYFSKIVYVFHNCKSQQYYELIKNVCIRNSIDFVDVGNLIKIHYKQNLCQKKAIVAQYKMSWTSKKPNDPSNYSPQLVMKIIKQYVNKMIFKKKDLFLFNYPIQNQNQYPRVPDQINAIQKELGKIRYVIGTYSSKPSLEVLNQKIQLVRPQIQKPVLKQSYFPQLDEQPPPPVEQQQKKNSFDVYDYEWSKLGTSNKFQEWFIRQRKVRMVKAQKEGLIQLFQLLNQQIKEIRENKDLSIFSYITQN